MIVEGEICRILSEGSLIHVKEPRQRFGPAPLTVALERAEVDMAVKARKQERADM